MKNILDLTNEEAKAHFLKGSSYFNSDLPSYLNFEPLLANVSKVLADGNYSGFKSSNPMNFTPFNGHRVKEIFDIGLQIQPVISTPMLNGA